MAQDEIGTVLELEVNGFKYVLKGAITMIKQLIKQINAFHNWKNEKHAKGSHSWNYIKAWSKETPQVVQIPDNIPQEVWKDFCKKNKIPYCDSIPDLDLTDRRTPVMFRSQDIVMIQQLIKPYVDELNKELETEKSQWEKKEDELNKIIRTSDDPKEIEDAKIALENVKCAKEQLQKVIDKNDEYTKNGNTMSFFDYLKQGANTELESNPSLALAKLNEGIDISKEYQLSEAMMLIRDPSLVPKENVIYLSCISEENNSKLLIKREFTVDDNGMAVSNAVVFRDGKEVGSFSDAGITPSEYQEKMKAALKEAGITDAELEQFKFRTDLSTTSFKAYESYRENESTREKVKVNAESKNNMSRSAYIDIGEDASPTEVFGKESTFFSEPKTEEKAKPITEDGMKFEKALTANRVEKTEEFKNNMLEIKLDTSKLVMINGTMGYDIEGVGVVRGIEQRKDADGNFNIAIHGNRTYVVEKPDGKHEALSGNEIRGRMNSIKEASTQTQTQARTASRGR